MLQKIGLMMQLSVQVVITFSSLPLASSVVIASMSRATTATIGAVLLTSTATTRTTCTSAAATPACTAAAVSSASCLGLQSSLSRTSEAHSIYLIYLMNLQCGIACHICLNLISTLQFSPATCDSSCRKKKKKEKNNRKSCSVLTLDLHLTILKRDNCSVRHNQFIYIDSKTTSCSEPSRLLSKSHSTRSNCTIRNCSNTIHINVTSNTESNLITLLYITCKNSVSCLQRNNCTSFNCHFFLCKYCRESQAHQERQE